MGWTFTSRAPRARSAATAARKQMNMKAAAAAHSATAHSAAAHSAGAHSATENAKGAVVNGSAGRGAEKARGGVLLRGMTSGEDMTRGPNQKLVAAMRAKMSEHRINVVKAEELRTTAQSLRQKASEMTELWQAKDAAYYRRHAVRFEKYARFLEAKIPTCRAKLGAYMRELLAVEDKIRREIQSLKSRHVPNEADREAMDRLLTARKDAINNMMEICNDRSGAPKVEMQKSELCEICKDPLLLDNVNSLMVCEQCNATYPYVNTTTESVAYGEEVTFEGIATHRPNHHNEWLAKLQGRRGKASKQDMQKIMEELYRRGIRDAADIDIHTVFDVLTALNKKKLYDISVRIVCDLCGVEGPTFPPELLELLRLMFTVIQKLYLKHKGDFNCNMMSYARIIKKCMRLIGLSEFLCVFKAKNDDRNDPMKEKIWMDICRDIDWQYIEDDDTPTHRSGRMLQQMMSQPAMATMLSTSAAEKRRTK